MEGRYSVMFKATLFSVLALAFAGVSAYEFVPGVVAVPEGTASRSKIVWAADGTATNGIVSCYRQRVNLAKKPVTAKLASYLDDGGTVFVNGVPVKRRDDIAAHLVAGDNTIAVRLSNYFASSAMMYLVSCEDVEGGRFYIHSDGSVKGTVNPQPDGWQRPAFDDSSWPQVKVCGDVLAKPWAQNRELWREFTTPEEHDRLEKADAAMRSLPAGLEAEPDPVAHVVYCGSRPYIEINGKRHDAAVNICTAGDPYRDSAIVRCAQAGFEIVQLNLSMEKFYMGDDKPCAFEGLDASVERILHLDPAAYLMLGLRFGMVDWAKRNHDEQMGYASGPASPKDVDDYRGRPIRPSAASDRYRDLTLRIMREFAAYVNARPWAKRVIGIRPMSGVYGEWHPYGMFEAPDTGRRMQEKFSAHMKAKRGVEAQVPALAARRHPGCDLLDPTEDRLVLDYFEFHADVMADLLLAMADEAKRLFPERLVGAYYGYLFTSDPPEGTNALLEKLLSSPSIDFLSNPPAYSGYSRRAGGSYSPRTVPSAFRRHGKLLLLEDDSRFHHIYDWLANSGQSYATETARETEMNMRRNWLNQLFDGDGIQLIDPMEGAGQRPHAFDDPAVFKAIAESKKVLAGAGPVSVASGNDVAVVMSPRERLRQDGGRGSSFTRNLYQRTFLDLRRSGISYDLLTLEDFLSADRDDKVVLFLNAFFLTTEERARLKARMRRAGRTAIWIGPAGGVTETGFDDAAMSDLVGIEATGVARRPRIVCRDAAAKPLCEGKAYVKALDGGSRAVLVPEPLQTATEYADLLSEAGAWRYVAPGSYFRRHGDAFMFHTGTADRHAVHLPEKGVKVRELFTGAEYSGSELLLTTDGPATWLFKIERD